MTSGNTEMTDHTEPLPFDPIAFCIALIGAPIAFTILTCVFLIPIVALIIGLPFYLAIGTPVLLWMAGRYPPFFWIYFLAGGLGSGVLFGASSMAAAVEAGNLQFNNLWPFGLFFGAFWSGFFALLYRSLHRPLLPRSPQP
jgi:hypothetical protein